MVERGSERTNKIEERNLLQNWFEAAKKEYGIAKVSVKMSIRQDERKVHGGVGREISKY